jgi:hypothetical protein
MQANLKHGYTSREYMGEPNVRFDYLKATIFLPQRREKPFSLLPTFESSLALRVQPTILLV